MLSVRLRPGAVEDGLVGIERGCSSTPPWTAVRSADVYRRRTTLDALGTPRAGRREEGEENEELGRRAAECSLALSVELLHTVKTEMFPRMAAGEFDHLVAPSKMELKLRKTMHK